MAVALTQGRRDAILVINAGSSSIKFSLFSNDTENVSLYQGESHLNVNASRDNMDQLVHECVDELYRRCPDVTICAIGHRVVHGGLVFSDPVELNKSVMQTLEGLTPLAPLHLPSNIEAIKIVQSIFPKLRQIACFDTAFHRTQNPLFKQFAIPRSFTEAGIVRYGFHGLSYEYIASLLPDYLGERSNGKVIVAHLGSGASMCAMMDRKSVATTMGLTPLDGLVMETRCGQIDPGVLLYLLQEKRMTPDALSHLLYHESGLLGVSGIDFDVRVLSNSQDANAVNAIDLFCYRAAIEFSGLCTTIAGCEALVFTAGIGEHSAVVREKICAYLVWMGVKLDLNLNRANAHVINTPDSKIAVLVIPTDEAFIIARHTYALTQAHLHDA